MDERIRSPRIQFLGAAGTVTGSRYLVTFENRKILVDCGLFQGLKELRLKNWDRFPIDPEALDAIILTHAHIDHSGYIPRLIKEGFRGKIYCTPPTFALCRILLPDTGYLQEEEAQYLNRKKLSKHDPALALFTKREAEASLQQFVAKDFETPFMPAEGMTAQFLYAGHILGAAQIILTAGNQQIAFSGDLGRPEDPIFFPPKKLPAVDYIVVESTYGNQVHGDDDALASLETIIDETARKSGVVLIPAFAVGRAQLLLYLIRQLRNAGRIPDVPLYLNSPLAQSATDIFCEFSEAHKLTAQESFDLRKNVTIVETSEQSRALNEKSGPMIIISASGMATGGRILHHLKAFAGDPRSAIVLTGFQAAGTRGQKLQDGAEEIKIHGTYVQVRARVYNLENLSAHADREEIVQWLERPAKAPKKVFITHGEPAAANALKFRIEERFRWNCLVPHQDQEFTLD